MVLPESGGCSPLSPLARTPMRLCHPSSHCYGANEVNGLCHVTLHGELLMRYWLREVWDALPLVAFWWSVSINVIT